jgi:hypothetical protein
MSLSQAWLKWLVPPRLLNSSCGPSLVEYVIPPRPIHTAVDQAWLDQGFHLAPSTAVVDPP